MSDRSFIEEIKVEDARIMLHLPTSKMKIVLEWFRTKFPEAIIITRANSEHSYPVSQISQQLLDTWEHKLLIVEATHKWVYMKPPKHARLVILTTDTHSFRDFEAGEIFLKGVSDEFLGGTANPRSFLRTLAYISKVGFCLPADLTAREIRHEPILLQMNTSQWKDYLKTLKKEETSLLRQTSTLELTIPAKISWLKEYFPLNPGKHVLWTGTDPYHIGKLLPELSLSIISRRDNLGSRADTIEDFNNADTGILVTDIYSREELEGVQSLIILIQKPYYSLIDSYLCNISNDFTLIYLMAVGPENEWTVDSYNYRIAKGLEDQKELLLQLLYTGKVEKSKLDWYQQTLGISDLSLYDIEDSLPNKIREISLQD